MAFTFKDLQDEVKRRATRNQGGTQYDSATKNGINISLLRTAREAPWRSLRRINTFDTVTSVTNGTGTVTVTNGSTSVTVPSVTLITTNSVEKGRRIELGDSQKTFTISAISESGGDTTITLDQNFDGTSSSTAAMTILPKEEYNLPIQASHRMFMWHNDYGYPYQMIYVPEQSFRAMGINDTTTGTPTHYRMWGEDMAEQQPTSASALTIQSSSSSDTSIDVTVFGIVSGYPDFEIITTNASDGTTSVSGSKSFTTVDRIVKSSSSVGRITVTSNSALVTVATLPVGDTTAGIVYRKIQLYPLPDSVFPMNVMYYKDPYRLVNDGDVHELGQDFDEAIILLTVAKIKYEDSQKEGDRFFSLFKDELKSLRRTNVDKIDWLPKLMKPHESTMNDALIHPSLSYRQLGGNFGPSFRR